MTLAPDILLIDGDILAYQAAAIAQETVDWGDGEEPQVFTDPKKAEEVIDSRLDEYTDVLDCKEIVVCLSDAANWRKEFWNGYKAHREGLARPVLLEQCKEYMREQYNHDYRPRLEADDVMGILSTAGGFDFPVIVSIDKDMQTVPGWLYNPDKDDRPRYITPEFAFHYHMTQTLTGDSSDGYKGCPGIGPKKAEAILGPVPDRLNPKQFEEWRIELWCRVTTAYASKTTCTVDALTTARLANILVSGQYNPKTAKVKLWKAPSAKA